MRILRLIFAGLISIGLVLSPVAAANAMASVPTTLMGEAGSAAKSSPDKSCPCCDMASKCVAATCAATCAQLAAPEPVLQVPLIGHVVLTAMVAPMRQGLAWQPPTPPPRG